MELYVVIAITVALAMLGMFLFMLAAFAGGGIANNVHGREWIKWLDLSLIVLPGSSAIAFVALWLGYFLGGSSNTYWWLSLPISTTAAYLLLLRHITKSMGRAVNPPKSGCGSSASSEQDESQQSANIQANNQESAHKSCLERG